MVNLKDLFFMHLFMATIIGGLLGEWRRVPQNKSVITRTFLSNAMGCMFLSFLGGSFIYEMTGQYVVSVVTAGIVSYQEVDFIMKILKKFAIDNLETALKMLDRNRGQDKDDKNDE